MCPGNPHEMQMKCRNLPVFHLKANQKAEVERACKKNKLNMGKMERVMINTAIAQKNSQSTYYILNRGSQINLDCILTRGLLGLGYALHRGKEQGWPGTDFR